ncbi:MAG: lipase family protein [Paenibacillaceae bacterium]|nr:lipase family protein [Paenibacillaceae bacterium]
MKLPVTFSNEEAVMLAAMIAQAYQQYERNKLILPAGYSLRHTIRALAGVKAPETEVFGYMAESRDTIAIVFRGIRTFRDNESDQDLYQVPYPFAYNAGLTHRGFTRIYESARSGLLYALNKLPSHKKLLIAGHNLGGALTVLGAFDIAVNTRFRQIAAYSYGSPRVGNPTFASLFDQVVPGSFRIANLHDVIPTLPAAAYPPPFTADGLYYRHVGTQVPLAGMLPIRL